MYFGNSVDKTFDAILVKKVYVTITCSPIITSRSLTSIFKNISLETVSVAFFETFIISSSVKYGFPANITLSFGIFTSPIFLDMTVQDIDLEVLFFPLINLYSLPILGPMIIKKLSSIGEMSTSGSTSVSLILIVKLND